MRDKRRSSAEPNLRAPSARSHSVSVGVMDAGGKGFARAASPSLAQDLRKGALNQLSQTLRRAAEYDAVRTHELHLDFRYTANTDNPKTVVSHAGNQYRRRPNRRIRHWPNIPDLGG